MTPRDNFIHFLKKEPYEWTPTSNDYLLFRPTMISDHIARAMVCRYGMSKTFGFQAFIEPNQFAAEEAPPPYSSKTAEVIDAEVQELISSAYARATKLLNDNRDKLELLATTLLEKETMDGRDVEKLLGLERHTDEPPPTTNGDATPPA